MQLVTVVGEPGLGKSRLVAELGAFVDARPGLVTWLQGRSLPYGEGITFWALGEIVKAHAGILESDPPLIAAGKLEAVLPNGSEQELLRDRLLPLVGIEVDSPAVRGELFAAWSGFLELVAEERPTVLVFEDLHWADEAMLAFLEHLADHAEGVPLLVVGTARPELYERHPGYADGLRNQNRINLMPLSSDETARLVAALLDTTALSVDLRQPVLERAEGNPLFAEEFVRLLKDRDLLIQGDVWALREGAELPFPESVQALIAARLDTLEPDAKSLLADAAVIGKVFWAGALAAIGGRDPQGVTEQLRALSRKELVRTVRRSTMEGEIEHSFWHVLVRDVAYQQLPRASRASRHVAAAAWFESKAEGRVEDLADVLAYHYSTALDLAQASGQTDQVTALEAPTRRFLILAGERAAYLDGSAAITSFERALTLIPTGHPDRPRTLIALGEALYEAGRPAEAEAVMTAALETATDLGERGLAARALVQLAEQRIFFDLEVDLEAMLPVAEQAIETFTQLDDSLGLAWAERMLAQALGRLDRWPECYAALDRALAHADTAGDQTTRRDIIQRLCARLAYGPVPVGEAIRRGEELLRSTGDDRVLEAVIRRSQAAYLAMAARFDEACEHLGRSGPVLDQLDQTGSSWLTRFEVAEAKELIGDRAGAEQELAAMWLRFRDTGGGATESRALRAASHLGLLYCDEGRWDDAAECLQYGQEVPEPTVFHHQATVLRTAVRARLAAHQGEHEEALRLAQLAVDVVEGSGFLNLTARVWLVLAEVQRKSGQADAANVATATALRLYERKGNIAAAARLVEPHDSAEVGIRR
jgi:tetratricopeptide (TPR) repeat protein